MKRRRLSDLYRKGKPLTIDDGQGAVDVWLQKLNPVDHDTALRRANAARARVLMFREATDSEEYLAAYNEAADFGNKPDQYVEYLIQRDLRKRLEAAEAELAAEDAWANDNYLQGLRDAWTDGLSERYAADNDDPEAKRIYDELKRFADTVNESAADHADALRFQYEGVPLNDLVKETTVRFIEAAADSAWLREFERCEIWLATRTPDDHNRYYFESRDEVDGLEIPVLADLIRGYQSLIVDVAEGKGSEETPTSSSTSEPSAEPETAAPSGHLAAVR